MHQSDHALCRRMNLHSDAIIVNQCGRNEIEQFRYGGHDIRMLSLCERGVGLSRNTALMRADADILYEHVHQLSPPAGGIAAG